MALEGFTSFVIEGEKGKEIYDMIMDLRSKLNVGDEIAFATIGEHSYSLSLHEMSSINGPYIELLFSCQLSEYQLSCCSYIHEIEHKNSILHIETSWRGCDSALMLYMEDTGMNDYPGYYYHDSSEQDIEGTTNDIGGKYQWKNKQLG